MNPTEGNFYINIQRLPFNGRASRGKQLEKQKNCEVNKEFYAQLLTQCGTWDNFLLSYFFLKSYMGLKISKKIHPKQF